MAGHNNQDLYYIQSMGSSDTWTADFEGTGQPHYVKLAYLEYTAYVEVIIHSRIFLLYCIVIRPCLCQTRLS